VAWERPDPEDNGGAALKPPPLDELPEPNDPEPVESGFDDPGTEVPAPGEDPGDAVPDPPLVPDPDELLVPDPDDGVAVGVLAAAFAGWVSAKANTDPPTVPATANATNAWVATRTVRRPFCGEVMSNSFDRRRPRSPADVDLPSWCRTVLGEV